MSNVQKLALLMQDLEDQLVVCMRCGMCQAVCPLYGQTGRESDVARGKLALLDGLMKEMFEDPQGVYQRLNKCLLCGSCAANCPSGVNVVEIFLKARAILTGFMGLSHAKRLVLRGMLVHPELFDRVMEWGARFQKVFARPVNDIVGTSCARIVSPLLADRHFLPLAQKPFHRRIASVNEKPQNGNLRVALFTGCLIDKIFPDIAEDALRALRYHRLGVYIPADQGCCGIPALSSGDQNTFARLVRHNINLYDPQQFDALVTACATCTSTIKKVWPMMIGGGEPELKEKVDQLARKTFDISQFLVDRVGIEHSDGHGRGTAVPVTYHDPCHLNKSLGVTEQPRALVKANPEYRLVEMTQADTCCGMGGSFNLQYYDISSGIGKQKRDHIAATDCAVLSTGCPACMLQISDMLSTAGDRIAVKHPIQLYAEKLERNEDTA